MTDKSSKVFYVYVIFRPNGIPCYVGKGCGDRWKASRRRKENPHLAAIARLSHQALPTAIIRDGLMECEALDVEAAFISALGRERDGGILVNISLGGKGTAGAKKSLEWRRQRSERAKEVWNRPDVRKRLIDAKMGNANSKKSHKLSDEWRAELAEKMRDNTYTLGMNHSPEARAKMSAKWRDPVWREKIMEKRRYTKTYSPETIAKRSAERVRRNALRRQAASE